MKNLFTGYTWEEAPKNLKNAAIKLASGLNITPVRAYQLILEKITEEDLKQSLKSKMVNEQDE